MTSEIVRKPSLSAGLQAVKARGELSTATYRGLMRGFAESGKAQTIEGFAEYVEALRHTRTAATVNLTIAAGRKAFIQAGERAGLATRELAIIKAALAELHTVRIQTPDVKTVSPEERALLFAALPDRVSLIAEVIYVTGCRVSEVLGVRWEAVKADEETAELRIRGKGDKERLARIPAELLERIGQVFPEGEFLFTTSQGHRYGREYISREIDRTARRVLGRSVRAHQLRHSRATDLYQATGRIKAVSKLLGHADEATTLRYYVRDSFTDEELFDVDATLRGM
jgi:integrase